jgi:phosphatidylinositol-3-phosphatase
MARKPKSRTARKAAAFAAAGGMGVALAVIPAATALAHGAGARPGLPTANGAIKHVVVIDLENESFNDTFGANSPATYLNKTLLPQGELLPGYYGTGHVSQDNYVAQVSGQAPNAGTSSDCIGQTGGGSFNDVLPGTLDPNQNLYPGQVDGAGCVFPASVKTIGNQLSGSRDGGTAWRAYLGDMGNDPARDGGTPDSLGGTDCAHPVQTAGAAIDGTNSAEGPNATGSQVKSTTTDQYADRHNPFIYFHAVIDDAASCARHVLPLGTATTSAGGTVSYQGHLANDFKRKETTPAFSFIAPNLCDDGHDATCAGVNATGTTAGGLVGADAWLKTWMPMILDSPAYRDGSTLVVITFDEGQVTDFAAGGGETPGPNSANPGYSPLLNVPIPALGGQTYYQVLGVKGLTPGVQPAAGTMPGGGQIGAVLLNPEWIKAGSVDTTGSYNHYSALRTYEDLLGICRGGADGKGHLGFAATATSFGADVFNASPKK